MSAYFRVIVSLIVLFMSTTMVSAKNSTIIRDWQQGTLRDLQVHKDLVRYDYLNNATTNANRNFTNQNTFSNGSVEPVYRTYATIQIEDDTHAYIAEQDLRWMWSKAPNLMINGPVRFAIAGRKLYVVDNEGKEHAMSIKQQFLKQTSMQAPLPVTGQW